MDEQIEQQGKSCKYIYTEYLCPLVGRIQTPTGAYISFLTNEYRLNICNDNDSAKKCCPYYQNLRKKEGISKRIDEMGKELTGIAEKLISK